MKNKCTKLLAYTYFESMFPKVILGFEPNNPMYSSRNVFKILWGVWYDNNYIGSSYLYWKYTLVMTIIIPIGMINIQQIYVIKESMLVPLNQVGGLVFAIFCISASFSTRNNSNQMLK